MNNKDQVFPTCISSIVDCKFHIYLRKFSMFMFVSPKILNLHDSMLYCHFENNKNGTSTTGLILPSQAVSQPFLGFVLHLTGRHVCKTIFCLPLHINSWCSFSEKLTRCTCCVQLRPRIPEKLFGKAIPQDDNVQVLN